jgi:hypothetical protein
LSGGSAPAEAATPPVSPAARIAAAAATRAFRMGSLHLAVLVVAGFPAARVCPQPEPVNLGYVRSRDAAAVLLLALWELAKLIARRR